MTTLIDRLNWPENEVLTTKEVAEALGITTKAAYALCCAECEAGRLWKYGYRAKDGWEDAAHSSRHFQSLGWQYCK